jgi:hypothetical protein
VTGKTVGSGHFVQLEVPEQVNAMIERFLAVALRDRNFGLVGEPGSLGPGPFRSQGLQAQLWHDI